MIPNFVVLTVVVEERPQYMNIFRLISNIGLILAPCTISFSLTRHCNASEARRLCFSHGRNAVTATALSYLDVMVEGFEIDQLNAPGLYA